MVVVGTVAYDVTEVFQFRGIPLNISAFGDGSSVISHCLRNSHLTYSCRLWAIIFDGFLTILLCKGKKQYLLTCKVSRYCLLPLQGSIIDLLFLTVELSEKYYNITRFTTS